MNHYRVYFDDGQYVSLCAKSVNAARRRAWATMRSLHRLPRKAKVTRIGYYHRGDFVDVETGAILSP